MVTLNPTHSFTHSLTSSLVDRADFTVNDAADKTQFQQLVTGRNHVLA